jgi:UTP--glucose-1-phosphate uridylyltransferase
MTMKVRKAVIPAAGLGTRFLPVTKAQPKEMLPVVDKPAIQYVVEEAARAGIDDILIITGRGKRSLEDHFDRNIELELELEERGKTEALKEIRSLAELADIHFIRQGEALGLGHAVSLARKHVGDQPFAVMLGDDLIDERVLLLEAMISEAERIERSVVALMEVDDPSLYGCARVEPADGDLVRILEIVEKPSRDLAPSNLAVMGRYVFTPDIFDSLTRVQPGVGGEIQLTDAIAMLLDGPGVYGYPFSEGRFDTGNKLDYLRANIELAARRNDLGPGLRAYIAEFAKREGLV